MFFQNYCTLLFCSRLVRGPGNVGDVTVNWIIIPAVLNEFAEMSGTVFMRDRQASATILLQVLETRNCILCGFCQSKKLDRSSVMNQIPVIVIIISLLLFLLLCVVNLGVG